MITRIFYILSQIFDGLFVFIFVLTLNLCTGLEIVKVNDITVLYTRNLALIIYFIFILIYFILYPIFNNKMSLFENIFSLRLIDKSIAFWKVLFTNMVFWLAFIVLFINLVDVPKINFHSNYIILFVAIIYAVFLLLEIDLISVFSSKIKFERE